MQLISKHSVLSAKLEFRLRCFDFGSFSENFFPDTDDEDVEAMITLHVFKSFAASHSTTRSSFRSGVVSKSAPKNPFHEARNERKIASSESRRIASARCAPLSRKQNAASVLMHVRMFSWCALILNFPSASI